MSQKLLNMMKLQASNIVGSRMFVKCGTIFNYDPQLFMARVLIQPDGITTGWLKIGSLSDGIFVGPKIGDICQITYAEGDVNGGIINLFVGLNKPSANVASGDILIDGVGKFKLSAKEIDFNSLGDINNVSTGKYTVTSANFNIDDAGLAVDDLTISSLAPSMTVLTDENKKLISGGPPLSVDILGLTYTVGTSTLTLTANYVIPEFDQILPAGLYAGSLVAWNGTHWRETQSALNNGVAWDGSQSVKYASDASTYSIIGPTGLSVNDPALGIATFSAGELVIYNSHSAAHFGLDYNLNPVSALAFDLSSSAASHQMTNNDRASSIIGLTGTTYGTDNTETFLGILTDNCFVITVDDGDNTPINAMLIGLSGSAPIILGTGGNEIVRIATTGLALKDNTILLNTDGSASLCGGNLVINEISSAVSMTNVNGDISINTGTDLAIGGAIILHANASPTGYATVTIAGNDISMVDDAGNSFHMGSAQNGFYSCATDYVITSENAVQFFSANPVTINGSGYDDAFKIITGSRTETSSYTTSTTDEVAYRLVNPACDAYVELYHPDSTDDYFTGVPVSNLYILQGYDISSLTIATNSDVPVNIVANQNLQAQFVNAGMRVINGIVDSSDVKSIDTNSRFLTDTYGNAVVDWNNYVLTDQDGFPIICFGNGSFFLNDGDGHLATDYSNRFLSDGSYQCLNWSDRTLRNTAGDVSLNWQTKKLYDNTGHVVMDYSNSTRNVVNFYYNDASYQYLCAQFNSETSDTKTDFKLYTRNGTFAQFAVDQLWNIMQFYTTATSMEFWSNGWKAFWVDGSQNFSTAASVTIGSALKLTPLSSAPSSPADGTMYVGGTAGARHLYVYLNSAWRTIV